MGIGNIGPVIFLISILPAIFAIWATYSIVNSLKRIANSLEKSDLQTTHTDQLASDRTAQVAKEKRDPAYKYVPKS